jgi:putative ABC transport system substrate-binding protein
MSRKLLLLLLIALLAFASVAPAAAQDDDVPTVAIIRFGPLPPFQLSQQGTLDELEAYGYVDGENINLIFGDAGLDFPTANALIEDALDDGADILITITTPVTQAAVNATQDLAEPPIILFNTVTDPYAAGIAQAACIKPDNIWGSQALPPYANIMPLLFEVVPDLERVGYIYTPTEANAVASTAIVEPLAEELGVELIIKTITDASEISAAAEAAVDDGAQIFFTPTDSTVGDGMPALIQVAADNGMAVVHSDSAMAYSGATMGAGLSYYQEGVDTARVLIAYLNGDIDIATTGISKQPGMRIGINLDTVALQGIEISDSLMERADFFIENGESSETTPSLPDVSMEELETMDADFVNGLFCSEERIAEQMEELEAADEG